MFRSELNELAYSLILGSFGRLVDGVLVATGCSHPCIFTCGGIAIDLATGQPYALIYDSEANIKTYTAQRLKVCSNPCGSTRNH